MTAVLMVLGAASQVPLGLLHPHHAQPNDSQAAFAEYAQSHDWVLVHLGQYLGAVLVTIGLVTLTLTRADALGSPASSVGSRRSPPSSALPCSPSRWRSTEWR